METIQQKNRIILLWPDGAPTSNGLAGVELEDAPNAISNISNPSLLVYPATKPNGKAILMCPGGGLSKISIGHEGRDMAAWFNAQGITYAVLKYRMPNGHREVPLDDVRQGLRILRNYSEEWKITKVGVMCLHWRLYCRACRNIRGRRRTSGFPNTPLSGYQYATSFNAP